MAKRPEVEKGTIFGYQRHGVAIIVELCFIPPVLVYMIDGIDSM
jgi:hypothetical protein